jgi:hypothetical protein
LDKFESRSSDGIFLGYTPHRRSYRVLNLETNIVDESCDVTFKLCFECQPPVSRLRQFGCKCFILKCGNLDKFESCSSDGIFLGYTPHHRSYRVLNLETNIVDESCDVSIDETAPCPHDVFESAGGEEMEESIFVDEVLHGFEGDEDEHIAPMSTSSPEPVTAPHLKQRLLKLLPLPQQEY